MPRHRVRKTLAIIISMSLDQSFRRCSTSWHKASSTNESIMVPIVIILRVRSVQLHIMSGSCTSWFIRCTFECLSAEGFLRIQSWVYVQRWNAFLLRFCRRSCLGSGRADARRNKLQLCVRLSYSRPETCTGAGALTRAEMYCFNDCLHHSARGAGALPRARMFSS